MEFLACRVQQHPSIQPSAIHSFVRSFIQYMQIYQKPSSKIVIKHKRILSNFIYCLSLLLCEWFKMNCKTGSSHHTTMLARNTNRCLHHRHHRHHHHHHIHNAHLRSFLSRFLKPLSILRLLQLCYFNEIIYVFRRFFFSRRSHHCVAEYKWNTLAWIKRVNTRSRLLFRLLFH